MNLIKTKPIKFPTLPLTFTMDTTRFLVSSAVAASITSVTGGGLTVSSSSLSNDAVTVTVTGGNNQTEYLIIATILDSLGNTVIITTVVFVTTNANNYNYYGNTFTDYFALNLNNATWNGATMQIKIAALMQATRAIERLNFVGDKLVATQPMQFPRNSIPPENAPTIPFPVEYDYPDDIENAAYEEASYLIDNSDTQSALQDINVLSEQLSSAKITYNRNIVPTNYRSGIMSILAWEYLQPYLRDPLTLNLSRAN